MRVPVPVLGSVPAVWVAAAAGVVLWVLMNSRGVTRALVGAAGDAGAGVVTGAAQGAADVSSKYGAPAYAVKLGDTVARTTWANTARGWVGLADLNSPEARQICQAAREAGDDATALRFCPPSSFLSGLLDGK